MNDVPSEDDDPLLGEVVDERFRLDEKLGEGAVGRVYLATQLSIERSVAIKVLHGEFRRDDEYQKRFQREARAISSFNHPNIVRLVDYGEDDEKGLTYLAMEFVEGLELYDIVEKGRVDPRCALEITSQVAAGLSAAHEADIIHRDLKASNIILVSVPGGIFQAKVLDFGVAFPKNQSKRMTTDGEVFGTPAYMSPEQARGKAVDASSDIYSLGIVLFEMLTGQLPFSGENTVELMVKHLQNDPPRLADVHPNPDVPDDLQRLLDTLLAKNPGDRPASGDEVRDRIEAIRDANDWGALHVDSNLGLEESLSKWILPEGDNRLTTDQDTGRPGSDRSPSLDAVDQQEAIPEAQRDTAMREPPRGDDPADVPASQRDPGPKPATSQQTRTEPPDRPATTHTSLTTDRLKIAVGVLGTLCILALGGVAAFVILGSDGSASGASAGGGESDETTPASAGAAGAKNPTGAASDAGDGASRDTTADADAGAETAADERTAKSESDDEADEPAATAETSSGGTSDEASDEPADEATGGTTPTGGGRAAESTDDEPAGGAEESSPPPDDSDEPAGGTGQDEDLRPEETDEDDGADDQQEDEGGGLEDKLRDQLDKLDDTEF